MKNAICRSFAELRVARVLVIFSVCYNRYRQADYTLSSSSSNSLLYTQLSVYRRRSTVADRKAMRTLARIIALVEGDDNGVHRSGLTCKVP